MFRLTFLILLVFSLLAASGTTGGGGAAAETSLIAYWPFDGDYLDNSGNGHHGTPSGDPVFVAGAVGQGLDLDGDGDYVEVGDSPPGLDGMSALTIDLRVYLRSYPTSKIGFVTKWGPAFTSDDSYELTLDASGQIGIKVFDGRHNDGLGIWKTTNPLPTNDWIHITMTWQPTADLHVYWDGTEVPIFQDPCPLCAYDTQFIQDTSIPFWMGRQEYTKAGTWLDGVIDEVKIYDKVVTPGSTSVGGRSLDSDLQALPLETYSLSSRSAWAIALGSVAAASLVALGGVAWYARRRQS